MRKIRYLRYPVKCGQAGVQHQQRINPRLYLIIYRLFALNPLYCASTQPLIYAAFAAI